MTEPTLGSRIQDAITIKAEKDAKEAKRIKQEARRKQLIIVDGWVRNIQHWHGAIMDEATECATRGTVPKIRKYSSTANYWHFVNGSISHRGTMLFGPHPLGYDACGLIDHDERSVGRAIEAFRQDLVANDLCLHIEMGSDSDDMIYRSIQLKPHIIP